MHRRQKRHSRNAAEPTLDTCYLSNTDFFWIASLKVSSGRKILRPKALRNCAHRAEEPLPLTKLKNQKITWTRMTTLINTLLFACHTTGTWKCVLSVCLRLVCASSASFRAPCLTPRPNRPASIALAENRLSLWIYLSVAASMLRLRDMLQRTSLQCAHCAPAFATSLALSLAPPLSLSLIAIPLFSVPVSLTARQPPSVSHNSNIFRQDAPLNNKHNFHFS